MVTPRSRVRIGVFCGMFFLGLPGETRASGFDVQGIGPESVAEVGARNASAEDGTAAFLNPAGLAFGQSTTLSLAPTFSFSTLQAQDKPLPLEDPVGITLTAAALVPLEGPLANRLRIGFSGYFLPTAALRLLARTPETPFYPYYDNRTQRLVALPALGIRLTPWLGIGVGANVLAGVRGPAKLETGASGAPEPRIDIAANTIASAVVGLRIAPHERIHLALVFRQAFGIPLDIETTANVGGIPLATNLQNQRAMFDPLTITLASHLGFGKTNVELNVSYAQWSAWEGPYMLVQSNLPGVNLISRPTFGLFRDTVTMRVGSNHEFLTSRKTSLIVRGGVAFEPTMLSGQTQGRTNLVDGNKLTVGLGASFVLRNIVGKTLRFNLGGNGQFLSAFEQAKRTCSALPCPASTVVGPDADHPSAGITNPGYPILRASGAFFTLALGVGVDF
jgi:hypothetical protein